MKARLLYHVKQESSQDYLRKAIRTAAAAIEHDSQKTLKPRKKYIRSSILARDGYKHIIFFIAGVRPPRTFLLDTMGGINYKHLSLTLCYGLKMLPIHTLSFSFTRLLRFISVCRASFTFFEISVIYWKRYSRLIEIVAYVRDVFDHNHL